MVVKLTKVSAQLFYNIEGYTQTLTIWPQFGSPLTQYADDESNKIVYNKKKTVTV